MATQKHSAMAMDAVYVCDEAGAYRNVHIDLGIVDDKALVSLYPDRNMTVSEVARVLRELEQSLFKKARITVAEECKVVVVYDGCVRTVVIAADGQVTALTQEAD